MQNKQFHRAVSGFEYHDLPGDFAYATFKAGGNLAGGIGGIGAIGEAGWLRSPTTRAWRSW